VAAVKYGLDVVIVAGGKDDDYSEVDRDQLVGSALEVARMEYGWRDRGSCVVATLIAAVCVKPALTVQDR